MVRLHRASFVTVIAVLVMSLSFSSCETLRKKFTRKKKNQNQEANFIPVLEPEDYPTPENNPAENYRQHYHLLKAWYRDLWTALGDKNSDKLIKYTIKQVNGHIDEMQKLLPPEKQPDIDKLRGFLKYYGESLDSPVPMRNKSRIESDLRAFDRLLRNRLNPNKLKEIFKPAKKG